jgi:hypothetical protein
MRGSARATLAIGAAAAATVMGTSTLDAQRAASGPKARYEMDVATTSGFGGMGALGRGGGNPMAALLGGGRGGSVQHQLTLRLGSTLAPSGGDPHADHFMPAGADLGASVPLVTPERVSTSEEPTEPGAPPDFRRPKGRMLIFWGCGAHAGPGQPVIIDFSNLAAGQMPPHLFSTDVPVETGPTEANSHTFGDWPNAKSPKAVSSEASLIGAHRVSGNYSPDIAFTLDQDFMAPLRATSQVAADGSIPVNWSAVPAATGYFASLVGASGNGDGGGDMVMWSSAARQEMGGGLADWLAPTTVRRLVAEHVVMPPTQTSCTVPAEVRQAAGQMMMMQLYAYGPEADFAYPPRPANPKAPWHLEWTARARYKSTTGLMLGMPGMAAMSGDEAPDTERPQDQPKPKCKPKGLGGFLKAKMGVGC